MNKLFLFPNSKARDNYLIKENGEYYSLDITNYKTIYEFYKNSIDNFLKKYCLKNDVYLLEKAIAIVNMHSAINEFTQKNKNSILSKQVITYQLASSLYSFLEEISFAKLMCNENIIFNDEHLKDINKIIEIYKLKNTSINAIDEFDAFEYFINSVKNKQIKINYDEINIYNFESLPHLYSIFLNTIQTYYNIKINIFLADECINNFKPYFKDYNINQYKISNFAKSLINKKNIKKDDIKLITAFGTKQEVDTVLDEITKLIQSDISLEDINIIYSDADKYHDILVNRLKECNINFNERRGNFIWKMPLIPVLMSVFTILDKKEKIKIDVENLIKILSSPFISNNEETNNYNIRNTLYANEKIVSIMPLDDFVKNVKDNKFILDFIELLKKLIYANTYKTIAIVYIEILKFLKVDLIFDNKLIYKDDNIINIHQNALRLFIELILKLEATEDEEKIDYYDFYSALSTLIEESYIKTDKSKYDAITLSNLYDARGIKVKHLFILGMNNDFLMRKPNTFFMSNKLREEINNKYKKHIFNTQSLLSDMYYNLFLNILSSLEDDSKVYFSFRFKDDEGNLDIPFYYLEDIASEIGIKDFNDINSFIYRKNYIADNIHTSKENMMSLFFERENYNLEEKHLNNNNKLPINIKEITKSVYDKINKNEYDDANNNAIKIIQNKLFGKKSCISVSYLLNIMQCPAKVLYNDECKIEAVSSTPVSIDKILKGTVYHEIFNNFYSEIKNKYNDLTLKRSEFDNYNDIAKEVIENTIMDKKEITDENDKKIMSYEINNIMKYFISNEIDNIEEYGFIPFAFEEDFNNIKVYSYNGFDVKIKGRIDRIDLSYRDDKTINGIRIIDYKGSSYNIKKIVSYDNYDDIINNYLQPLLYLKYAIEEYIIKQNKNIDIFKQLEKCELGFSIYKEENVVNKENHYIKFDDKETILTILGYNGENVLHNYFDKVLRHIADGELIFIAGENQCRDCIYYNLCKEHYVYE
ncbi:PD-(D/E)XK nuclease family protein [Brachyspira sp. SAP_772]|uniref:PD-(D/E)XK nuclease family protein n=1 Tax=Brachyspira sp. SAP_772 TaxID=2608385 RepID=UPI0012F5116C|nr:PD-(D/E)XK nuclease family protein [Brachyspira sp. SAP_772]